MRQFFAALVVPTFALLTSVSAAQTFRPATWTCPESWWSDDLCDCGCGAYDRDDCVDAYSSSCEYTSNMCADPETNYIESMTSANWRCESGNQPPTEQRSWGWQEYWPATWYGFPDQYTDNVCSCGFGAFDMACSSPFWWSCEESSCPGDEDPNNNWDCYGFMGPQWYYNTNDGCDCGWGEFDPDCVDARLESCQYFAPDCQVQPETNWSCQPTGVGDYLPDIPYCDAYDGYDPFTTPLEEAVLAVINMHRAEGFACAGWYSPPTHPLYMDRSLRCAARPHSEELSREAVAPHDGFNARLAAVGVPPNSGAGEIVSFHYNLDKKLRGESYNSPNYVSWSYADGLVRAMLESPVHCAIMMDSGYDKAGVGVAGPYQRGGTGPNQAVATIVLTPH